MNLIIVESPTKSKTLARFLGKDYQVVSTMGHIRDLPKKKLSIDVEKDFKPEYALVPQKKEAIQKIKDSAKKAKKIFLATDPDREGEAIAFHIAYILKRKVDGLARIVFHEITKEAIEKALAEPKKINLDLFHAQQARRILDRLVGYKLSPLLWRKIRRGLSAGRVQSVAVRLIVDREREIEKFVPEEYWEIWAKLKKHLGGQLKDAPIFEAKLIKKNGQTIKIENETQSREMVDDLKKANYEVYEVERKEVKQRPLPPFSTSTLQQNAVRRLGFSSKRTMYAAQRLYEKGLITYHRTDSLNLANSAVEKMRAYINSTYGQEYVPEQPYFYRTTSKVAQEAHEAVRPTDIQRSPDKISEKLGREEQRLYELIWKRALASQMKAALWDKTRIKTQATSKKNIYLLMSEGKIIKFAGWLILDNRQEPETGMELPEVKKSDDLDLVKLNPKQKFTLAPPRYSEASLIKALEERGIGRPSTYAPTISTIQTRQYVEKLEGLFQPTPLGTTVNDFLVEYFSEIVDYDFTAKMEDELDEIADGKRKWVPVIKDFYQPFEKQLEGVAKVAERVQIPTEVTDEKCPECKQGKLVIRIGKFGKFLSCSRFPECKYTAPYVPKLKGVKCSKCGGEIVVRRTRKGKQFYGCSNYPKCNWASWTKPK
ncbi:DNA topoisomerase I [Microgenomates group bacterium RBG_19FT_COMBO_39_10]|nr:MAG: DNA topoisomerase I [Microgenomates group bacterium RBG_19FT_COMBO_39_10]